MTDASPESSRILREYERRDRDIAADFYALHHSANLFLRHSHEEAILWGLRVAGLAPLTGRRVLEVGCGTGRWLRLFEEFGAKPEAVAGIELGPERAATACAAYPSADIRVGDAANLPWSDGSFELVFQCTVMTSILDPIVRRRVADEMLRVLSPDGAILWLDFFYDNPRNAQVRGVRKHEIAELFPSCSVLRRRVSLAPPLARRLVPWSWRLARLLEMSTLLNTHYTAVIRRRTR